MGNHETGWIFPRTTRTKEEGEDVNNMLDTEKITNKYYAQWLGIDELIFNNKINILFNPERDNIPRRYSYPMEIYILLRGETIFISYGSTSKEIVGELMKLLQNKHGTEYIKNNPNCIDNSWVEDYFLELVKKKYCHGIIVGDILASATDAPDMPYMSDCVQEIGINVLEAYRGKGYAQMACISMINELVSNNICPMWSAGIENNGSNNLAKKIGFEKYCDVLTIKI